MEFPVTLLTLTYDEPHEFELVPKLRPLALGLIPTLDCQLLTPSNVNDACTRPGLPIAIPAPLANIAVFAPVLM